MTDVYKISPWFSSPKPCDSRGRALVLPGGGYTVDHPVLFWACQVLTQVGWLVTTMRWRADGITTPECQSFVEKGASILEAEAEAAPRTVILAKSLGSYAARWASTREYPAIWLTPVMTGKYVMRALRTYAAPSLLVGGTADPLWSAPLTTAADQQILELLGVDHALHRPGDWQKSLAGLHEALTAVENFAATIGSR